MIKTLKETVVFNNIDEETIKNILEKTRYEIKNYSPNESIAFRGDEVKGLYIILKGTLITEMLTEEGNVIKIEELVPSDVIALSLIHIFQTEKKKIAKREEELKKLQSYIVKKESPEIDALKKEKEKLEKELIAIKEKKELDHKQATIQSTTTVVASGNGISINSLSNGKEGLDKFSNEGVISGYTEIYHGHSQGKYSRVDFKNSGAGLVVEGNTKAPINNAGIISGTEFALLAKGERSTAYDINNPTYTSGFKGGVNNYGILAGRVIIGGYGADTGTQYFETIYKDKAHYKNFGLFMLLDRNGEVRKVIGEDKETVYNGRTVKNILDKDGTYEGDTTKARSRFL